MQLVLRREEFPLAKGHGGSSPWVEDTNDAEHARWFAKKILLHNGIGSLDELRRAWVAETTATDWYAPGERTLSVPDDLPAFPNVATDEPAFEGVEGPKRRRPKRARGRATAGPMEEVANTAKDSDAGAARRKAKGKGKARESSSAEDADVDMDDETDAGRGALGPGGQGEKRARDATGEDEGPSTRDEMRPPKLRRVRERGSGGA